MARATAKKKALEKDNERLPKFRSRRKRGSISLQKAKTPSMDMRGAKALAAYYKGNGLKEKGLDVRSQHILSAVPRQNGPHHKAVVHVKFLEGPNVSSVTVS